VQVVVFLLCARVLFVLIGIAIRMRPGTTRGKPSYILTLSEVLIRSGGRLCGLQLVGGSGRSG